MLLSIIICILIVIILVGIFYQYKYDDERCKNCRENMCNYTYDLLH